MHKLTIIPDANLAIESLKQPKAVMTPFKTLMDTFPDGMAGLYRQELRALDPELRHILLVALRWTVCGEGRISTEPVADELEKTFQNSDPSDEEDEDEDAIGADPPGPPKSPKMREVETRSTF